MWPWDQFWQKGRLCLYLFFGTKNVSTFLWKKKCTTLFFLRKNLEYHRLSLACLIKFAISLQKSRLRKKLRSTPVEKADWEKESLKPGIMYVQVEGKRCSPVLSAHTGLRIGHKRNLLYNQVETNKSQEALLHWLTFCFEMEGNGILYLVEFSISWCNKRWKEFVQQIFHSGWK